MRFCRLNSHLLTLTFQSLIQMKVTNLLLILFSTKAGSAVSKEKDLLLLKSLLQMILMEPKALHG